MRVKFGKTLRREGTKLRLPRKHFIKIVGISEDLRSSIGESYFGFIVASLKSLESFFVALRASIDGQF